MRFLGVIVSALLLTTVASLQLRQHHKYVVVGAGPGGVQAAYYLQKFKMDYVVLERSDHVGSFFDQYPRHRTLISINKASVPLGSDPDFAMRHDWNSLLSENDGSPTLLFKNFTRKFLPPADKLVEYLAAYHKKHNLNIALSHPVTNVHKNPTTNLFEVSYGGPSGVTNVVTADIVLIGTGKDVPNKPQSLEGSDLVTNYKDVSTDPAHFKGKEVLVFGAGNAALETVDWLQDHVAHVHLGGRRPILFAFQTHYVGDARAVNLQILDKYQLKSLDAVFSNMYYHEMKFIKVNGRIHFKFRSEKEKAVSPLRRGYDHVIGCFGFKWNNSIFDATTMPRVSPCGKMPILTSEYESANVSKMFFLGNLMHARDFRKSSGGFIHGFRYVVRTLIHLLRDRFESVPYPFTNVPVRFYSSGGCTSPKLSDTILVRINKASSLYQMFGALCDVYVLDDIPEFADIKQIAHDHVVQVKAYEDVPLDILKNGLELHGITRNASRYLTVTFEYGDDFQGTGVMLHRRQALTDYLKKRKIVVPDYDEDPDEEYKRRFIPLMERKWPHRAPAGTAPWRDVTGTEEEHAKIQEGTLVSNLTLAPESDYVDSNKFIHPVVRVWVRSDQVPKQISVYHMQEDFLTDWTLPEYRKDLANFLHATIHQLQYGEASAGPSAPPPLTPL